MRLELACEFYFEGGRNANPEVAHGEDVGHVGGANACAKAAECAVGAAMGVGSSDDHTGANEALLGEENMTDACGFAGGDDIEEVCALGLSKFDHLLVHVVGSAIGTDVVDLDEVIGNKDDFFGVPEFGAGAKVLMEELADGSGDRIV